MPIEKKIKLDAATGEILEEIDVNVPIDTIDAVNASVNIDTHFRKLRGMYKQLSEDLVSFDTYTAAQRSVCQKRMLNIELTMLRLLRDICLMYGYRQEGDV
jgi:hypothetical protein